MKNIFMALPLLLVLMSAGCKVEKGGEEKTYPDKIPAAEKIPVVAWHGVRASQASAERFKEAEDMGITLNYTRMGSVETAVKVLDYAAQTGVKVIVECDELYSDTDREDAVRRLKGHPALYGYFVMDEPRPDQFPGIKKMIDEISHFDNKHLCYSNLFPNGPESHYAALGVKDYEEYVDRYLAECPVTFLSFDKYPILLNPYGERFIQADWYEALEIIRDRALKAKMDFWSFLLTVPHASYPQPTADDLRLQAYSNLAYGTQVLQCFTYWTPSVANPEVWNYRNAPIAEDGTRTETYDIVKSVLAEVQNLAWVFRGNKVTNVYHIGKTLPQGTHALENLPSEITELSVARDGNRACVSFFENHGYNFMMVVNTDINDRCFLNIATQSHVRRILRDGSVVAASNDDKVMSINAGDKLLYMW